MNPTHKAVMNANKICIVCCRDANYKLDSISQINSKRTFLIFFVLNQFRKKKLKGTMKIKNERKKEGLKLNSRQIVRMPSKQTNNTTCPT